MIKSSFMRTALLGASCLLAVGLSACGTSTRLSRAGGAEVGGVSSRPERRKAAVRLLLYRGPAVPQPWAHRVHTMWTQRDLGSTAASTPRKEKRVAAPSSVGTPRAPQLCWAALRRSLGYVPARLIARENPMVVTPSVLRARVVPSCMRAMAATIARPRRDCRCCPPELVPAGKSGRTGSLNMAAEL